MTRARGVEPAVPAHEEEAVMARPKKSALSRERVVTVNKGKAKEKQGVAVPRIKVIDRASAKHLIRRRLGEHPDMFVAHACGTQLKCLYCNKFLSPKSSNISEHLKTAAHIEAIATMTSDGHKMIKTADYFKKYFESIHAVGETINSETLAFRVENMEMMLLSGSPIEKLDSMRPTLEKHGKLKLTSSTNMRRLIPPMLQRELDEVIRGCREQNVVVIFDGTSKLLYTSILELQTLLLTHFY
jgi:hypothetical protein